MRGLLIFLLVTISGCASSPQPESTRWWKGNLHTHSLWSDGADFPEMIAAWYKQHGYHFLAVTEHDMLQQGERWVDINARDAGWPPRNASTRAALPGYRAQFGADWVQERLDGERHLIRLRGLSEYRHMFEEPDRFLLVMGEEVTDKAGAHLNAMNLRSAVLPRGGATNAERIRNNLAAVAEQRQGAEQPIIAIVNHPNYVWALTADDLASVEDARLFEVYNGHRLVNNEGDSVHPSTERLWDVALTRRHEAAARRPLFGVATDDAHEYRSYSDTTAMPGRGWVMVRAPALTTEHILRALHDGDFYASTGVTLQELRRDSRGIRLRIVAEPGVTYQTKFIGTRIGSDVVGEVLAEVAGPAAEYRFTGNERYVRAVVVSSRRRTDPVSGNLLELERAWVQPVMRWK